MAVSSALATLAGFVTLLAHEYLPTPWTLFGDSIAAWVAVPYLLALPCPTRSRAALVGACCGLGLNLGYYGGLVAFLGRTGSAAVAGYWTVLGAVVGSTVAVLAPDVRPQSLRSLGAGLVGGGFWFEAVGSPQLHDLSGVAGTTLKVVWCVLGVACVIAVPVRPRGRGLAALALAGAVPVCAVAVRGALALFDAMTT